jgi:tetratricopeptide (TPR) repeat protein
MYAFIVPGAFFFVQGILRKKGKTTAGISGLLLLALCLLGASEDAGREKYLARVDQGAAAYDGENYSEAIRFFLLAAEGLPGSPGVYYNLGLASAAAGDRARAIFYLRGAAVSNPASAFIRRRLYETEKESGITHGTGVPRIHPDMFFFLFTLFFLAVCVLPRLIKKKSSLFACLTPVVLAAVLSAGGIFCQAAALDREWAVVSSGGGEMRKVPLPDSSDWLNLAEGTAVDILSHSGRFVLVAAGSGVEGWMDAEDLLIWRRNGGEKNEGEKKDGE